MRHIRLPCCADDVCTVHFASLLCNNFCCGAVVFTAAQQMRVRNILLPDCTAKVCTVHSLSLLCTRSICGTFVFSPMQYLFLRSSLFPHDTTTVCTAHSHSLLCTNSIYGSLIYHGRLKSRMVISHSHRTHTRHAEGADRLQASPKIPGTALAS